MNTEQSYLRQSGICFRRCIQVFRNEKGWKAFVSAALMTLLICAVTGEDLFVEGQATETGAFTIMSACIWSGLFHSLRSICRERDILKKEHRTGLHISSYITAHWLFEACVCLVLALIISTIVYLCNMQHYTQKGVILPPFCEYLITYFLITFAADSLGILISSCVRNENSAMTVMPFALILQLIMSGLIFPLKGVTKTVSALTISRWGLNAICATAHVNYLGHFIAKEAYDPFPANLYRLWGILLLFAFLYALCSVLILQFIDKDTR